MSVQECLESFMWIFSELFERKRRLGFWGFPRPKDEFNLAAHVFEEYISITVEGLVSVHEPMVFSSPPDLCRT
jgi:hypothetical protein